MLKVKVQFNDRLNKQHCVQDRPLRMIQRREANPQKSDFVARSDHVAGADAHRDFLDRLQILVELGEQPRGGVLLEAEELTAREEEENQRQDEGVSSDSGPIQNCYRREERSGITF